MAYSQRMLQAPCCLACADDFHHQGHIFSSYKTHKTNITGCFNQHKQMSSCTPTQPGSQVSHRAVQQVPVSEARGSVVVICWHWRYQWFGCSVEWHFQAGGILAACSQVRGFQGEKSRVWADALAGMHYLLASQAQHHPSWYNSQIKRHDIKKLQLFLVF